MDHVLSGGGTYNVSVRDGGRLSLGKRSCGAQTSGSHEGNNGLGVLHCGDIIKDVELCKDLKFWNDSG